MNNIELLRRAREGDGAARDELVAENTGLVWSVVRRFSGRGYEAEDLFQTGCIGMIKAIDKFDFSYKVAFSTYAIPMIAGEIRRFLRDDGMIKISRSIRENRIKLHREGEKFFIKNGREATVGELSAITGISGEDAVVAMETVPEVESIDRTVSFDGGDGIGLIEKLARDRDDYGEILNVIAVRELMEGLDDYRKNIIFMRYFENKTQSEVAKTLGISQVQVSRLEKKILMTLRLKLID